MRTASMMTSEEIDRETVKRLREENAALRQSAKDVFEYETQMEELKRENAALKKAIQPFVRYAIKHGGYRLCGRNGAVIAAEDWARAGELLGVASEYHGSSVFQKQQALAAEMSDATTNSAWPLSRTFEET